MKLDIALSPSSDLRADADLIKRAEDLGFDAAWTLERGRNPFFALTIAAEKTRGIRLGAQAAAFPRSPMVTAQIAWDLARQSNGRFLLGLYTEQRENYDWHEDTQADVGRMREYIEGLRAIWDTFQTDARLRYRGEHYTFRLMAPFFNPGPVSHPDIPVFLSGADPALCTLAGERCQGLHAPGLHTRAYLDSVILPALSDGLSAAGRARSDVELAAEVFVVSGLDEAESLRAKTSAVQQLALQHQLPMNQHVIRHPNWGDFAGNLQESEASKQREKLAELVTDDMLSEVAIVAEPQEVLNKIRKRYGGIADRVCMIFSGASSRLIETIMTA
ncbi:MAG: TIGR03617 family F420-dependent LLM class oxidoreductase [Chloroflexi bacterium]|nr:TIGR03617 family F420-dependent LLM class oxidoreductase [Chloroflexota bacterium]